MRKIISLLLIIVCLITSLCSCDKIKGLVEDKPDDEIIIYTEGLGGYVIEDNECVVSVGSAYELEEIIIPKTIDGNKVVAIDTRGFLGLDNLKNVSVPEGVYYIGDEAFMYCCSLMTVYLPEGVTRIGKGAFNCCCSLIGIRLSEGLTRIEEKTFYFCEKLTDIDFPSSVTYIGRNAFTGCGFTELTIPDHITYIDEYAFSGCKSLTKVYIPEGTHVARYVFNGCDSLETVVYGGTRAQWENMMRKNETGGYEDTWYRDVNIIFEK